MENGWFLALVRLEATCKFAWTPMDKASLPRCWTDIQISLTYILYNNIYIIYNLHSISCLKTCPKSHNVTHLPPSNECSANDMCSTSPTNSPGLGSTFCWSIERAPGVFSDVWTQNLSWPRDGYPTIFWKNVQEISSPLHFDPTISTIQIDFSFGSRLNLSATHARIHTLPASASPIFFTNSKVESPTHQVSTERRRRLCKTNYLAYNIYIYDTPNTTWPWEEQSLAVWQIFDPGAGGPCRREAWTSEIRIIPS